MPVFPDIRFDNIPRLIDGFNNTFREWSLFQIKEILGGELFNNSSQANLWAHLFNMFGTGGPDNDSITVLSVESIKY